MNLKKTKVGKRDFDKYNNKKSQKITKNLKNTFFEKV